VEAVPTSIGLDASRTRLRKMARCFDVTYLFLLLVWSLAFSGAVVDRVLAGKFFSQQWTDFCKFYAAGQTIASPQHDRLFDPYIQRERIARIIAPTVPPPVEIINGRPLFDGVADQPPYFLMLYAPLSSLQPRFAMLAVTALYLLTGLAGVIYLCRAARTLNTLQSIILVAAATAAGANCWAFVLGQPAWLLVGLYAACCAAWLQNRWPGAGAFLALCTIKPQYPPIVAVGAFAARKWKLIAWCALTFACLVMIAAICVGPGAILSYLPQVFGRAGSTIFSVNDKTMISVRGLFTGLLGAPVAIGLSNVLYIASLAGSGWLWWRTQKNNHDRRWALAATLIAATLFNPHSYRYDALLLVVPAALTLRSLTIYEPECSAPFKLWRLLLIFYPLTTLLVHLAPLPEVAKTCFTVTLHAILFGIAVTAWARSGAGNSQLNPPADIFEQ
jgi:hypothetical protein